ncbi:unnamed protein product [Anisakis simplex]|uniref:Uncharacterized protein n=1 Tax=Anisakis simplex TaxID=6269 RepID=A0A0M3JEP0_ANISI|nr:unnamed protein product [Anisakis simplex]
MQSQERTSDDEGDAREGSSRETSSHSSDSSSVGEQPPPPKRFSPFPSERSVQSDGGALSHSASVKNVRALSRMPVTQSQTSLVSYGGAGEEEDADDQFAKG